MGSVTNRSEPARASARAKVNERVDIVRIGDDGAIEKAARLRHILRGQTSLDQAKP